MSDGKVHCFSDQDGLLGSLSKGAKDGLTMAGYVVINLLIYVAILAFLDQTLLWFTERAGVEGFTFSVSLAHITFLDLLAAFLCNSHILRIAQISPPPQPEALEQSVKSLFQRNSTCCVTGVNLMRGTHKILL